MTRSTTANVATSRPGGSQGPSHLSPDTRERLLQPRVLRIAEVGNDGRDRDLGTVHAEDAVEQRRFLAQAAQVADESFALGALGLVADIDDDELAKSTGLA